MKNFFDLQNHARIRLLELYEKRDTIKTWIRYNNDLKETLLFAGAEWSLAVTNMHIAFLESFVK